MWYWLNYLEPMQLMDWSVSIVANKIRAIDKSTAIDSKELFNDYSKYFESNDRHSTKVNRLFE